MEGKKWRMGRKERGRGSGRCDEREMEWVGE